MGGPQQQQMQRGGRKRVQRGLEDNVRRTVYISYIDQQVRPAGAWVFMAMSLSCHVVLVVVLAVFCACWGRPCIFYAALVPMS
jgi:hypothetical protein